MGLCLGLFISLLDIIFLIRYTLGCGVYCWGKINLVLSSAGVFRIDLISFIAICFFQSARVLGKGPMDFRDLLQGMVALGNDILVMVILCVLGAKPITSELLFRKLSCINYI